MNASNANDEWIDSPFRAKGVLYLGTRTFFEAHLERGLDAVVDELPEGRLRDFIRQRFLAGGQYEVLCVPALIAAEARALHRPLDEYLLQRTRWQAEHDIHGVYRLLLKLTNPEMIAMRVPKVVTQMFNFGTTRSAMIAPNRAEMEAQGIPALLVPWLSVGFRVYVQTTVLLAGAKTCAFTLSRPVVEPPREGFAMRSIRATVEWT